GRREVGSQLLSAPHRALTPQEWKELVVTHLLTYGAAYLALERNGAGAVVFADPLDPSRCAVRKIIPTEANPEGRIYNVTTDKGSQDFTSYDVLHIPGLSLEGVVGLGAIHTAREGIAGA